VFGADGLGLVDERLGELPLVLAHRPDELRRRAIGGTTENFSRQLVH
jgi:hypothetical protein